MTRTNLKDATKDLLQSSESVMESVADVRKGADILMHMLRKFENQYVREEEIRRDEEMQAEQERLAQTHTKAYTMPDSEEEAAAAMPAEPKPPEEKQTPKAEEAPADAVTEPPVQAAPVADVPDAQAPEKIVKKPNVEAAAPPPQPVVRPAAPAAASAAPQRPYGRPANPPQGATPAQPTRRRDDLPVLPIRRASRPPRRRPANPPQSGLARPANPMQGGIARPANPMQGGYARPASPQGNFGRPANPQGPYGRPAGPQGNFGRPANPQGPFGRPANPQGPFGRPANAQGPFGRPAGSPGGRPVPGRLPVTPEIAPAQGKERVSNYDPNKKAYVNRRRDAERTNINRKHLARQNQQGTAEDEIIRGGRRARAKKPSAQMMMAPIRIDKAMMTNEAITVKDLTERIGKPAGDILKKLLLLGVMANINSELDYDTASLVCSEFGVDLEFKLDRTAEDDAYRYRRGGHGR